MHQTRPLAQVGSMDSGGLATRRLLESGRRQRLQSDAAGIMNLFISCLARYKQAPRASGQSSMATGQRVSN